MTRLLEVTLNVAVTALLLCPASWAASDPRRYATLDEKTVAEAIQSSPHDYLAAVVEVVARCEVHRDDTCSDRVRILDLIAQAPQPAKQRVVGEDLFLFSGKAEAPERQDAPARYLVFVVPMASSVGPTVYGARLMNVAVDAQAVDSLRNAVNAVVHK